MVEVECHAAEVVSMQEPGHVRGPAIAQGPAWEGNVNRDELEGKAEAVKGKVKQATGDLTNDQDLHDEGVADEAAGKTQDAIGRGRRKVGEAINEIGDAIKR